MSIVDRIENSEAEVAEIENTEQLLKYLNGKYFLFHNVLYLQGLFQAVQEPELCDICLEYAKAREKKVTFFYKEILENGTKVKPIYFSYFFIL